MCSDKYEPERLPWGYIDLKEHFNELIGAKLDTVNKVMDEREKATINAAQALITKDGSEQLSKFVLKQELTSQIIGLQDQITGSLGLELRMRSLEQQKGIIDAKLYVIIIGLSALITAITTAAIRVFIKS